MVIEAERSVAPLEKDIKEIKEKITKISRVQGSINDSDKVIVDVIMCGFNNRMHISISDLF